MKLLATIVATICSSLTFSAVASGYVLSPDGQPVRDGYGQCVRTGTWVSTDRLEACDGKQVPTKMIMNSDVLFGFDRSDLTTAGKQELDRLAGKIVPDSGVTVTGHTDWIGNAEYNQALSVRRAQTVANYLQSRVDAVYTVAGMGSQDPLEGTESCREDKNWNTLVACLAPNRRVVITVIK